MDSTTNSGSPSGNSIPAHAPKFIKTGSVDGRSTFSMKGRPVSRSTENLNIGSVLANTTSVAQNNLLSVETQFTSTPPRTPSGSLSQKSLKTDEKPPSQSSTPTRTPNGSLTQKTFKSDGKPPSQSSTPTTRTPSGSINRKHSEEHPLERLREPSVSQRGSPRPPGLHPGLTIATTYDPSAPSAPPSPSTARGSERDSMIVSVIGTSDAESRRPTNMSEISGPPHKNDDSQRSIPPIREELQTKDSDLPTVVDNSKKNKLTLNINSQLVGGYHAPETPTTVVYHGNEERRKPKCQIVTNICLSILSLGAGIATTYSPVRYVAGPILIALSPFFGWNAKKLNTETSEKVSQLTKEKKELEIELAKLKNEVHRKTVVDIKEKELVNNVSSGLLQLEQEKARNEKVAIVDELEKLRTEVKLLRINTKAIEDNQEAQDYRRAVNQIVDEIEISGRKLNIILTPQESAGFNDARSTIHRLNRAHLLMKKLIQNNNKKELPEEKTEGK